MDLDLDSQRAREWRAVGRLAGTGLGEVVGIVRDTHTAVAARVGRHLPPVARPVLATERLVSSTVYGLVATAHRLVPQAVARLAAVTAGPGAPPPALSRFAEPLRYAANGLWGDRLLTAYEPLAVPMSVRVDDADVVLERTAVREAYPLATQHLVVFVHGLGESDRWWWRPRGGVAGYPDLVHRDLGLTPVLVRYNTGLRISDNGARLADLLRMLWAAWPVPVRSLSLVGHSMGGLVARSACHAGDAAAAPWVPAVRAVVTLGTPHLGAPLEKSVHVAEWLLRQVPESEPLSRPLGARSVGIKDLRFGAIVDADWVGYDPDELLRDRCTEVPLLPHAAYHWVAGTLSREPDHLAGRLVGDGLVRVASASGSGRLRRIPFETDHGAQVGGVDHLGLLNHPAVYERLRVWLDPHHA
jgi:hypothetical protein